MTNFFFYLWLIANQLNFSSPIKVLLKLWFQQNGKLICERFYFSHAFYANEKNVETEWQDIGNYSLIQLW